MADSDSDDDARTTFSSVRDSSRSRGESLKNPTQPQLAGASCCCLILVALILASFKGLHATKYALTQNYFTGVVSFDPVYYGGRNFVGFWKGYVEFPATIQSIEWLHGIPPPGTRDLSPFRVRTFDGLLVNLGISTQYLIVKEKIPEIYRLYKDNVEEFFISNLRSELQETIAGFPATSLYTERIRVKSALKAACEKVCREDLHGFLTCWYIDLVDVELDQRIEVMNVREQVEKQKQWTEMMKQNASLIRTDSQVMAADFDRQTAIVVAEAEAAAYNITQEADAEAQRMRFQAGGVALGVIQENMMAGTIGLSSEQMLYYLEKLAIMEEPIGPLVYGSFEAVAATMNVGEGW